MIFQWVVVLMIVLCTLFWAWQGALSATLMFVASLLASVLAAGLYEDFVPWFAKYRPDYAEPVMFFLVFAFAFSVLRMAGGMAAPRNIHLPKWADLGIGAVMGFLTALMTIGTLVIGVEMLPTYQKILTYDRYPNGMAAEPAKLWIAADDFVLWAWSATSGGSLGGQAYTADHPDLIRELYGDRHVAEFGSYPVVPQDRLAVSEVFVVNSPDVAKTLRISGVASDSPVKVVIVRSRIAKGNDMPDVSSDTDNFYRVTPAEVRLVTGPPDHAAQFFPVGYMDEGTQFTRLDIDKEYLVEDYTVDKSEVVHDWVFVVPAKIAPESQVDTEPRLFGEKQIAVQDISALAHAAKPDAFTGAVLADYPPRNYLKGEPDVQISVRRSYGEATNQPVVNQDVYLLRSGITKRKIRAEIDAAWDAIHNSDSTSRQSNENRFNRIKIQMGPGDEVPVGEFVSMLLIAEEHKDANEDVRKSDHFINDKLMPILLDPDKDLVVWKTTTDEFGKTPEKHIAPGNYVAVTWSVDKDKGSFHFWALPQAFTKKTDNDPLNLVKLDDSDGYSRSVH